MIEKLKEVSVDLQPMASEGNVLKMIDFLESIDIENTPEDLGTLVILLSMGIGLAMDESGASDTERKVVGTLYSQTVNWILSAPPEVEDDLPEFTGPGSREAN